MINFIYNDVQDITMCTALPAQKKGEVGALKSIAIFEQTTADLGFLASQKIIQKKNIDPNEIGALIFLTKTPDYRGPATAMVLQNRLQIPHDCIVYDSITGNGGFESAINLGSSLLNASNKKYNLIVLGDTVSKQLNDEDTSQLNFQDGATALLLHKGESSFPVSMSTTTLSKQWSSFMVPSGGFRNNESFFKNLTSKRVDQLADHLHIDYSRIFKALKPELTAIKEKVTDLMHKYTSNFKILINLLHPALEQELASLFRSESFSNNIYLSTEYLPQTMASTIPILIEKIAFEEKQTPFQVISISIGEGLAINIGSIEVRESTVLESIYSDEYYSNGFVTHEM